MCRGNGLLLALDGAYVADPCTGTLDHFSAAASRTINSASESATVTAGKPPGEQLWRKSSPSDPGNLTGKSVDGTCRSWDFRGYGIVLPVCHVDAPICNVHYTGESACGDQRQSPLLARVPNRLGNRDRGCCDLHGCAPAITLDFTELYRSTGTSVDYGRGYCRSVSRVWWRHCDYRRSPGLRL